MKRQLGHSRRNYSVQLSSYFTGFRSTVAHAQTREHLPEGSVVLRCQLGFDIEAQPCGSATPEKRGEFNRSLQHHLIS
jgi:hypothetical protein